MQPTSLTTTSINSHISHSGKISSKTEQASLRNGDNSLSVVLCEHAGIPALLPAQLSKDEQYSESTSQYEEPNKVTPARPSLSHRPSSIGRRLPFINDEAPLLETSSLNSQISWRDLPHKGQLVILTLARLSEPLTQTSLQAYMYYQLKSFNPSLPVSTIASQAGILQGSFTAAQFVTAILWGRAADADWGGRKKVLLIGLLGTCISCIGFGFSRSFVQAVIFRTLGGALNGNMGVLKTMISEIVKEKK